MFYDTAAVSPMLPVHLTCSSIPKKSEIIIANIKVINVREVHNFLKKRITALNSRSLRGCVCKLNRWNGLWLGCKLSRSTAVLHIQNGTIFLALSAPLVLLLLLYSDPTTKIVLALIMVEGKGKTSRHKVNRVNTCSEIQCFEGEGMQTSPVTIMSHALPNSPASN